MSDGDYQEDESESSDDSISDQAHQPPRKKFAIRKEDPKNYQPGDRDPSTSARANSQTDSRNQGVEVGSKAEQNKHID